MYSMKWGKLAVLWFSVHAFSLYPLWSLMRGPAVAPFLSTNLLPVSWGWRSRIEGVPSCCSGLCGCPGVCGLTSGAGRREGTARLLGVPWVCTDPPGSGFPGGSAGKEFACNVGDPVQSLGWEDPLEKGKATHSRIQAWRIPWTV